MVGGARGTPSPDVQFPSDDLLDLLRETRKGLDRVTMNARDPKDCSRAGTPAGGESADLAAGPESRLEIVQHAVKCKDAIERRLVRRPPMSRRPSRIGTIMQRHHDRTGVQSEPGRGSIFRVSLPRSQPECSAGRHHDAGSATAHCAHP